MPVTKAASVLLVWSWVGNNSPLHIVKVEVIYKYELICVYIKKTKTLLSRGFP